MKGKLLFAAALMAAAVTVTQAVRTGNGGMFLQLPEEETEGTTETPGNPEGSEETPDAPETDKVRPDADNTDVTAWIVNPTFDEDAAGWTCIGPAPAWVDGHMESASNAWNKPMFDFYQDISLPNGVYSVSVQEHATIGDRADLYIQSSIGRATAKMNWNNGDLAAWADENVSRVSTGGVLVVDGKVRIGVNQYREHRNQTLYFDNFKLLYLNDGIQLMLDMCKAEAAKIGDVEDYPKPLQERAAAAKADTIVTAETFQETYDHLVAEVALLTSTELSDYMQAANMCSSFAATLEDGNEVKTVLTEAVEEANTALAAVETVDDVAAISEQLNTTFRTATEGMEITYVVAETDFTDAASAEGWNGTGTVANGVMEFFNKDFDFNREFRSLPEGWYQITLNGFYRPGAADEGESYKAKAYTKNWTIYGNAYEMPLMCIYEETGTTGFIDGEAGGEDGDFPGGQQSAAANFQAGRYADTLNVWVADKVLKMGVKGGGTDANRWVCLDNVKLTYKGDNLPGMYEDMAGKVVKDAAAVSEAYGAKATEVVTTNRPADEADYTVQNVEALNQVMVDGIALDNALIQFNLDSVLVDYTRKKEAILPISESTPEVREAYEQSLTDAGTAITNALGVADVEAVRLALADAYADYMVAAEPTEDNYFDMTFLLTNPKSTGDKAGWYCDVKGGDAGKENTTVGWSASASYRGDADVAGFIEKWSANILSPAEDGSGWLLYQKAALPAGAYRLMALAFTDMPFNANTEGDNPVTGEAVAHLSMGFGNTVLVDGDAFDWQEHEKMSGEVPADQNKNKLDSMEIAYFYLAEDATEENPVKLGINIKAENKADWFGINDMKLYKVAPQKQSVALDETKVYAQVSDVLADEVTLKREMAAGGEWNALCVPFSMNADQLAANHITEVRRMLTEAVFSADEVTLQFSDKLNAVEPGVPYFVRVDEGYTGTVTAENVPVVAAAPSAIWSTPGIAMQGFYSPVNVPLNAYYVLNGGFYQALEAGETEGESNVAQNGFRAYIAIDENSPAAEYHRLLVNIDGVVTAIGDVVADGVLDVDRPVDVYTLSGVKVKSGVRKSEALDGLQRGIYIVDGKKVVK